MDSESTNTLHLLELAAKCRRIAASLSNENDVASLIQMATHYEAMVTALERSRRPALGEVGYHMKAGRWQQFTRTAQGRSKRR